MFKLFKRVSTVMSSELNALIDKAEDPVKMLEQFMRDMEADIREAETAVAKQIANEKMLKKKYDDSQGLVQKREAQAIKALEAGDESLARRALEDKKEQQRQAETLKEAYERAKADADSLRNKLNEMKDEYHQMKLKKDSLKARAESAKTKTKINRAMSGIGSDESKKGFERMEEKVLRYEAEAETSEDLRSSNRSLDDEFEALGKNDEIDDELAELKKKMGKE
ncbi:PspA/IM30 family protein [Pseudalkalibacillus caeni]|uniref:PspA/IM30 family protein n=1 Tax=Exobacillus caeni TaxID=2574798 RepID=A0A5R9F9C9_9BACL|nr:PspA/IM30 family protein [Pseudalkalibacillus caeni]TLS39119.1 PspA/IM30 family protein [Pseudalkalibacillus caeni]